MSIIEDHEVPPDDSKATGVPEETRVIVGTCKRCGRQYAATVHRFGSNDHPIPCACGAQIARPAFDAPSLDPQRDREVAYEYRQHPKTLRWHVAAQLVGLEEPPTLMTDSDELWAAWWPSVAAAAMGG